MPKTLTCKRSLCSEFRYVRLALKGFMYAKSRDAKPLSVCTITLLLLLVFSDYLIGTAYKY